MVKLVIGYDGSQCAIEAIEDLRRAGLPRAGVEAVVMSIADVWPTPPGPEFAQLNPAAARVAHDKHDTALAEAKTLSVEGQERVARLFPGWHVSAEAVPDSPYWGLVKKTEEWGADLLMLGSQGRSAVGRMVFGSVSQHAVWHAACSVRIGRRPANSAAFHEGPVRILLGWDGSTGAELAAHAVRARSWPVNSEVRIVTALDARLSILLAVSGIAAGPAHNAIQEEYAEISPRADEVAEELRAKGLVVGEPVIRPGHPKGILLEEADKWQADCLFVGAKGLSRIERVLLGSVSASVAARAACSVEVVRSSYPA